MDAVPMLTLIDENETEKAPPPAKRRESVVPHILPKAQKRQEAMEYFNTHNIPESMNALLTQILLQRPANPLSFCIMFLRTAGAVEISKGTSKGPKLDYSPQLIARLGDESAQEYLIEARLPWMFDDLLNNLLLERPEDPHSFCLTWLRWNRHNYSDSDKETDIGIALAEIPHGKAEEMEESMTIMRN